MQGTKPQTEKQMQELMMYYPIAVNIKRLTVIKNNAFEKVTAKLMWAFIRVV
jgi:hypothetical protein